MSISIHVSPIWLKSDSPLLICGAMCDLKKPQNGSHASDPIYHPLKMALTRIWKCYWRNRLAWYEQSDWPKNVITVFIISFIIHAYSWQKVTRSWPVMGFIQISHTSRHISKEEQVIDLILIRLISLHSNGLQEIFVHWPGFWMSMLMLWSFLIRFYFINICLTTGILVIKRRPQ